MSVVLLAALLAGMLLINVAVAWTLARRNRGPDDAPDAEGRPSNDGHTGFDALLAEGTARDPSPDGDDASRHDRSPAAARPSADDPPPLETDEETVVCGNCGARNRTGYRYCRWCVRSALVEDGRGRGDAAGAARRPL
ncbi:DUF7577 domain-containing protein [Halorubrum cibi]|uniref:DUF7577 domain-containing protein n=1 Tax=Halorubrum cibi TaxID=413815 RepID=A0A521BJF6_9EURY|nr:zinc ribbon domain-containing protein [Halorubrum cibi]SMO47196.1 hypothetical protein SAMN06264867_102285 [Halorubrum cibi]